MDSATSRAEGTRPAHPTFREGLGAWARIAALSFGGPAGQIAVMHRIVVEEKRWVSEARFLHALNYCMLLPGPEAQQLATYLGWLTHRTSGGVVAGLLFVLPGALAIMALSIVYAVWGDVGIVAALFYGLQCAVLAIVLQALVKLSGKALRAPAHRALAAAAFLGIFVFGVPFPVIVIGAGVVGFLGARAGLAAFLPPPPKAADTAGNAAAYLIDAEPPAHARPPLRTTLITACVCLALWLVPVAALLLVLGPNDTYSRIALFFSQMAMVTFGGAYAVLAYVAQQAVETYAWLAPGEMMDGLALAETTPGPLIMVLQFVGFLAAFRDPGGLDPILAGVLGGLLTTWVTFAPCFLWIFLGAPFMERLRENRALAGALAAITAAVVGVILNLAVWFAIHVLFRETVAVTAFGLDLDAPVFSTLDPIAAVLVAAAIVAIFKLKLGMLVVLAAAALAGAGLGAAGSV